MTLMRMTLKKQMKRMRMMKTNKKTTPATKKPDTTKKPNRSDKFVSKAGELEKVDPKKLKNKF